MITILYIVEKAVKTHTYEKNNIDFESRFWSGRSRLSPAALGDVFFHFHDLATAKERLNLMMQYAVHGKTRIPEDPSVVFHFHKSLRSFLRAGWCLRKKSGKWAAQEVPELGNPLLYGSLSEKEYHDPVRVFRKAFQKYRTVELEDFLSDIVYFSLGTFHNVPERDIVGPHLHLMKMLDAAWLITERKNRKKDRFQSTPQEIEVQIR